MSSKAQQYRKRHAGEHGDGVAAMDAHSSIIRDEISQEIAVDAPAHFPINAHPAKDEDGAAKSEHNASTTQPNGQPPAAGEAHTSPFHAGSVEAYVTMAKDRATVAVEQAKKTAEPYVETAKFNALPYVEGAKASVENMKDSAAGIVAQVKRTAEPYVETAKFNARPYVEGAKASVENMKDCAAQLQHDAGAAIGSAKKAAEPYMQTAKESVSRHMEPVMEGVKRMDVPNTAAFNYLVSVAGLVLFAVWWAYATIPLARRIVSCGHYQAERFGLIAFYDRIFATAVEALQFAPEVDRIVRAFVNASRTAAEERVQRFEDTAKPKAQ